MIKEDRNGDLCAKQFGPKTPKRTWAELLNTYQVNTSSLRDLLKAADFKCLEPENGRVFLRELSYSARKRKKIDSFTESCCIILDKEGGIEHVLRRSLWGTNPNHQCYQATQAPFKLSLERHEVIPTLNASGHETLLVFRKDSARARFVYCDGSFDVLMDPLDLKELEGANDYDITQERAEYYQRLLNGSADLNDPHYLQVLDPSDNLFKIIQADREYLRSRLKPEYSVASIAALYELIYLRRMLLRASEDTTAHAAPIPSAEIVIGNGEYRMVGDLRFSPRLVQSFDSNFSLHAFLNLVGSSQSNSLSEGLKYNQGFTIEPMGRKDLEDIFLCPFLIDCMKIGFFGSPNMSLSTTYPRVEPADILERFPFLVK